MVYMFLGLELCLFRFARLGIALVLLMLIIYRIEAHYAPLMTQGGMVRFGMYLSAISWPNSSFILWYIQPRL